MNQSLWRWVLVASLALNVLFASLLVTTYWTGRSWGSRSWSPLDRVERVIDDLDEPQRSQLRELLEARRPAIQAAMEAAREARREASTALAAEPFDHARWEAANAESRERWGEFFTLYQGALAEIAPQLDAESRGELVPSRSRS